MGEIRSYHDLEVWKQGRLLVKQVYEITALFPKSERYGLSSQMRRAAVSLPSNIAEGHSRRGIKDYIQFVSIAIGSASELDTQLFLAEDLGYIDNGTSQSARECLTLLQKRLHALRNALKTKQLANA